MTKNKIIIIILSISFFAMAGCTTEKKDSMGSFDRMRRTVEIGNWQFLLNVENQSKTGNKQDAISGMHYLKATLYLSNIKTEKSLLYSVSKDIEDYEAKYKYLSFGAQDDLYIKWKEEFIYPIGYVFEPSNGLSKSERLVYKFQVSDEDYKRMLEDNNFVEYWYLDRLIGLGKICFKPQQ